MVALKLFTLSGVVMESFTDKRRDREITVGIDAVGHFAEGELSIEDFVTIDGVGIGQNQNVGVGLVGCEMLQKSECDFGADDFSAVFSELYQNPCLGTIGTCNGDILQLIERGMALEVIVGLAKLTCLEFDGERGVVKRGVDDSS